MCYQRVLWDDRLTTNRLHSEEGWREIAGNIGRLGVSLGGQIGRTVVSLDLAEGNHGLRRPKKCWAK